MAAVLGWKLFCYAALIAEVLFATKTTPAAAFSKHQMSPCTSSRSLPKTCHRLSETTPELSTAEGGSLVSSRFVIALTREKGKNDKLKTLLLSDERIGQISDTAGVAVQVHELPCIEHADGPDTEKLIPTLSTSQFDYIVITSPEAASVLASAWNEAGRPHLGMVAAVGKATEEALTESGIDVAFVPSKATAATLVKELPPSRMAVEEGRATTVFYPASAKAQDTLQTGLEDRGFNVLRLDTYDTVPASWNAEQILLAQSATVACFASPSAVQAWLENTADFETPRALASCIGETSATACRKHHWKEENIFFPEKPGVDGWAMAVADALDCIATRRT